MKMIKDLEEKGVELNNIYNCDCLEGLKLLDDNSIDAIVTDPPYGLGFMGKEWDVLPPSKEVFEQCFRVLKPGGHLLSFGGTRTYHRMAVAIEDSGFEIRDMIEWVYGSGFPKSLNVGKVADKFLKTGNASWNGTGDSSNGALGYSKLQHKQDYRPEDYSNRHQNKDEITEERAKQYEGWGTALKPSHEPICMARKPLAEKNVAENCLKYGTGGINIDESRVGTEERTCEYNIGRNMKPQEGWNNHTLQSITKTTTGRFPANLIHDNSEEVRECFPDTKSQGHWSKTKTTGFGDFGNGKSIYEGVGEKDKTGGNSSRFFKSILYYSKASKSERNKGCEELEEKRGGSMEANTTDKMQLSGASLKGEHKEIKLTKNNHPTVKPIALMEYLIKMVTPKGGIVLDPFAGSGTTLVASKQNGFNSIGFELCKEYCDIAEKRLKKVVKQNSLFE